MSNITCYDSDGNLLKELYQWDRGQIIKVRGLDTSTYVVFHFCNINSDTTIEVEPTVSDSDFVAEIPDSLLTQPGSLIIYLYKNISGDSYRTFHTIHIPVIARAIPDEYEEPNVALLTYKSEDGSLTYQTFICIDGADGRYYGGTPNKEPQGDVYYVWDGWSTVIGGSLEPNATVNVTSDRTVYAHFHITSVEQYSVHFMNFQGHTDVELQEVIVNEGEDAVYTGATPTKSMMDVPDPEKYVFKFWSPQPTNIRSETWCYAQYDYLGEIKDSWDVISSRVDAGIASNFYSVGDCKQIVLNGSIGDNAQFNSFPVWAYILGFDEDFDLIHDHSMTFGCFMDSAELVSRRDGCLCDEYYDPDSSTRELVPSGEISFTMGHWWHNASTTSCNYGGWKGCDLRYDILGSTNVPPSGYGSTPQTGREGFNATSTCATNPVPNTLMSLFPSSLRAVMKPMKKYTDNVGGATGDLLGNVSESIDYLPLLSPKEVFGSNAGVECPLCNSSEFEYANDQYTFYRNGGASTKYKIGHEPQINPSIWWLRSPCKTSSNSFICIDEDGHGDTCVTGYSIGLAPVFCV